MSRLSDDRALTCHNRVDGVVLQLNRMTYYSMARNYARCSLMNEERVALGGYTLSIFY